MGVRPIPAFWHHISFILFLPVFRLTGIRLGHFTVNFRRKRRRGQINAH